MRQLAIPVSAVLLGLAPVGLAVLLSGSLSAQPRGGLAYSIELRGTVDPATERWLGRAVEDARDRGARIAVVRRPPTSGRSPTVTEATPTWPSE